MAKGTTHMFVGFLLAVVAIYLFPYKMTYKTSFIVLICAVAGSLFPDIDTRSRGRTFMYYLMIPAYALMIYHKKLLMCLLISCIAFLPLICVHRGLFHRVWFIAACTGIYLLSLFYLFPQYAYQMQLGALFFFMGAISHLCLDFYF